MKIYCPQVLCGFGLAELLTVADITLVNFLLVFSPTCEAQVFELGYWTTTGTLHLANDRCKYGLNEPVLLQLFIVCREIPFVLSRVPGLSRYSGITDLAPPFLTGAGVRTFCPALNIFKNDSAMRFHYYKHGGGI